MIAHLDSGLPELEVEGSNPATSQQMALLKNTNIFVSSYPKLLTGKIWKMWGVAGFASNQLDASITKETVPTDGAFQKSY